MRVDEQTTDMRRQCRTSGQLTAKSVSIKGAKRRSDDCAWKAAEITPGDLSCVVATRLREPGGDLTAGQKSAEGIVGHDVGKASEALRNRKVESTDRPNRERWPKARTRGEASRT
jgi:hypothetical protein